MTETDVATLREEVEHFRAEKEKIRAIVGRIGGASAKARDRAINTIFVIAIVALFGFDLLRHVGHIPLDVLPPMFSLELAVLLVSVKIIWMIHKQTKVEHFQFHILNSIEFRLNALARRLSQQTNRPPAADQPGQPKPK